MHPLPDSGVWKHRWHGEARNKLAPLDHGGGQVEPCVKGAPGHLNGQGPFCNPGASQGDPLSWTCKQVKPRPNFRCHLSEEQYLDYAVVLWQAPLSGQIPGAHPCSISQS